MVALLFILALSVLTAIGIGRFASAAFGAQERVEVLQEALVELDFDTALVELEAIEGHLSDARSGLKLLSWLKLVPWLGDQVQAVASLTDAGLASLDAFEQVIYIALDVFEVVQEAEDILSLTQPDGEYTFENFPEDLRVELLRTLHHAAPELYEIRADLQIAQAELDTLEGLNITPALESVIEPLQLILPGLIDGVELLAPFAGVVEDVVGVDEDRQWLVLFLNDTEIRPGGGFMGVFGLVQVRDGAIKQIFTEDTYAIDQLVEADVASGEYFVEPPQPLVDYSGVNNWYFRDANWSPDFAQSAQDAMTLLRQEYAQTGQPVPEIHGTIGLTTTFAEMMMEILGPIEVAHLEYTSENFTEQLEYQVEFAYVDQGIAFSDRKDHVGDLLDAVLERLFDLPSTSWPSIFTVITDAFAQKELALFAESEDTQLVLEESGWAGTVDVEDVDDVLMVVDANIGALKSNHAVEREVSYSIDPDPVDGRYKAHVYITYDHQGTFDWRTSRYRTFTRVYAPQGSEFIMSKGGSDVTIADELGMTSFGAFFTVEPGEQGSLSFQYYLPESVTTAIDAELYQLRVMKQLGAKPDSLTLELQFGKTVRAAEPSEDPSLFGDSAFELNTTLTQDEVFTIQF